jgi:hypothetical protein
MRRCFYAEAGVGEMKFPIGEWRRVAYCNGLRRLAGFRRVGRRLGTGAVPCPVCSAVAGGTMAAHGSFSCEPGDGQTGSVWFLREEEKFGSVHSDVRSSILHAPISNHQQAREYWSRKLGMEQGFWRVNGIVRLGRSQH